MSIKVGFSSSETRSLFFGKYLEFIEVGFNNGYFIAKDPSELFRVLTQLPNTGTRLDWDKIAHIGLSRLPEVGNLKAGELPKQQQEFLRTIGNYFHLVDERGYLFEDRFSDCAIEMSYEEFLSLVPGFIEMPAHWYFLSVKSTWLVNLTFEDDIYFSERLSLTNA